MPGDEAAQSKVGWEEDAGVWCNEEAEEDGPCDREGVVYFLPVADGRPRKLAAPRAWLGPTLIASNKTSLHAAAHRPPLPRSAAGACSMPSAGREAKEPRQEMPDRIPIKKK